MHSLFLVCIIHNLINQILKILGVVKKWFEEVHVH